MVPAAQARARHSDAWAREHFANAERQREALNGRPAAERSRRDYQRVLNAYRSVYLGAPGSSKADPSVVAVAETLVEMGRRFEDDKILHAAIAQYKFLRREYPGSKYRVTALFTIGEIYKDDLGDADSAGSTFQEFVRRYPNARLAEEARDAMVELKRAQAPSVGKAQTAKKEEKEDEKQAEDSASDSNGNAEKAEKAAKSTGDSASTSSGAKDQHNDHPTHLARVTGIRHWSTPDYTRIAIDLEGDVKFTAERIARPARIYFDLHDTRLASTLVGKSFDVDDGFLKKVRVAQFLPSRTRVVLDIDSLSEYDAFLIPNPYRLIIDIHGKNDRAKQVKSASESMSAEAVRGSAESDEASAETTAAKADEGGSAETESTTQSKRSQKVEGTTVKKVVVDADDDDVEASTVPPRAVKEKTGKAKGTAEKDGSTEASTDSSSSDSKVLKSKRNHIVDAPHRTAKGKSPPESDVTVREATPTASGDRSLIRALGLKIGKIVIDPGHGGHDTGTIGPNGLEEKDLVLEVGRRLGKLLETRLGAEVVYTRKDDTFIPLETRTAVANQARADLFVSIHANSSHDSGARGVETYYLNFTSSPEALEVAARENAVSEKSIYELQDLVKKIALKEKIEESREFAADVQQSLHSGLAVKSPAIRDRGVKKAPFIVLIGANMPSILAEVSFVSNPTDERRLSTSEYRQRIAESLYRGIAKYVNGLSGVKMASKIDRTAGQ